MADAPRPRRSANRPSYLDDYSEFQTSSDDTTGVSEKNLVHQPMDASLASLKSTVDIFRQKEVVSECGSVPTVKSSEIEDMMSMTTDDETGNEDSGDTNSKKLKNSGREQDVPAVSNTSRRDSAEKAADDLRDSPLSATLGANGKRNETRADTQRMYNSEERINATQNPLHNALIKTNGNDMVDESTTNRTPIHDKENKIAHESLDEPTTNGTPINDNAKKQADALRDSTFPSCPGKSEKTNKTSGEKRSVDISEDIDENENYEMYDTAADTRRAGTPNAMSRSDNKIGPRGNSRGVDISTALPINSKQIGTGDDSRNMLLKTSRNGHENSTPITPYPRSTLLANTRDDRQFYEPVPPEPANRLRIVDQQSFIGEIIETLSIIHQDVVNTKEFCKKEFRRLHNRMDQLIDRFEEELSSEFPLKPDCLPLLTRDEVEAFEHLRDEDYRKVYLGALGGATLPDTTNEILKNAIDDGVSRDLTWQGREKNTIKFGKSRLAKAIYAAAAKNKQYDKPTWQQFSDAMVAALKASKQRNRNAQNQASAVVQPSRAGSQTPAVYRGRGRGNARQHPNGRSLCEENFTDEDTFETHET